MNWELIAGMALGWLTTLTGVVAGGYMVFRTKREDPFLRLREPKGEAFNLDEGWDKDVPEGKPEPPPEVVQMQNDRFIRQFAANLRPHRPSEEE